METDAMRHTQKTHRNSFGGETGMPKIVERIGVLEERLKQLEAKQQKIDARRRALETRQTRQADTRRKFLAGAIVLARVERDEPLKAKFRQWLDESLTREEDRALFELAPLLPESTSDSSPSHRDPSAADASVGSRPLSADGPR
jgi:hypothetical protein